MKVIVDFCLIPLGTQISLTPYIAECQRLLKATKLEYQLHAYGTNIEGEWDEVMGVIKQCHEKVHEMGAPRITSTLKLGTRTDRKQTMADKVAAVENELMQQP